MKTISTRPWPTESPLRTRQNVSLSMLTFAISAGSPVSTTKLSA